METSMGIKDVIYQIENKSEEQTPPNAH